jgi:hypothetical protein
MQMITFRSGRTKALNGTDLYPRQTRKGVPGLPWLNRRSTPADKWSRRRTWAFIVVGNVILWGLFYVAMNALALRH